MGRLIDVDELRWAIRNNAPKSVPIWVYQTIDNVPTVYDQDKVVEQLEKRRMNALRRLNENKGTAFECASEWVYNAWNDAIEIVKGGGVDGNQANCRTD